MKYCPICQRKYEDEMRVCGIDGTPLVGSERAAPRQDPVIGKTIKGRYHVLRKLGQGGMGAVYLAEQLSIGRKVALKLMRADGAAEDEFVARFRREARLAAALNHRNIVMTYDFDQDDDGALFIAMEFLNGSNLAQIIRGEGPLSIERATDLALQVAEGLEAAHRAGVIHRDIKPDNVMVVDAGGVETVKLMDFGIARLRDAANASRLTRADVMMGTPAYMAPEQAQGGDANEKTDIYALGIVVYEMLTGAVPFQASTPSAVLLKHIQETPLPLRKVRREIPAALESVVMQALEKEPGNRQADMHAVAAGLRSCRTGETQVVQGFAETLVLPSGARDGGSKLLQPAFKYAGMGVVALVLLGGIGFGAWKFIGSSSTPAPAKPVAAAPDLPGPETSAEPPRPIDAEIQAPPIFAETTPARREIEEPAPPPKPAKGPLRSQTSMDKPSAPATDLPRRPPPAERVEGTTNLDRSFTESGSSRGVRAQAAKERQASSVPSPKPPEVPAAMPPPAPPPRSAAIATKPAAPAEHYVPPVENAAPAASVASAPKPAPVKIDIQEFLRAADRLRARGQYADARVALEKARAVEPSNKEVQAALEKVARACEAERKILNQPDLKC
jgi:serine/threonine-protein kinase